MGRGNRSGPLRGARQQEWTIFGTGQQVWTIFGRGNNSGPSLGRGNRSGQSLGRGKQEWTIFGTGQQQGTIFGTGQQEWTNTFFFFFFFCDGATKETCGNVVTGHHNYRHTFSIALNALHYFSGQQWISHADQNGRRIGSKTSGRLLQRSRHHALEGVNHSYTYASYGQLYGNKTAYRWVAGLNEDGRGVGVVGVGRQWTGAVEVLARVLLHAERGRHLQDPQVGVHCRLGCCDFLT